MAYKGNPLLRKANITFQYTQDQIDEILKCSFDCQYFIENYVKIVNVDKGLVSFNLYDYQKEMVNTMATSRFVITKMPRQSGKSTTVTSYILWLILFKPNQSVAILANKGRLAMDLLAKVKTSYEYLPLWMQQGILTWHRGSIELENGSKILAAATSSSAVRGGSYNCLLLDEFAHIPKNLAEEFFASVYPTISSGETTQVIIVSTPFGMNHYYKMWTDAVEGRSLYVPVNVHWSQIPGRDQKWAEETIRNTSQRQFDQEFECNFLGSTNTLISAYKLSQLTFTEPTIDSWGVDIYEDSIPGHSYVITVDSSHGVGLDYSAFSVIDVTSIPYKLVAKYRNNNIGPLVYPEVIVRTAIKYQNAYILAENNDVGMTVIEAIANDLEYENVFRSTRQKVTSGFAAKTSVNGVKMTKSVKHIGCSNIKDMIEQDKFIIRDFEAIGELSTFISDKGTYKAEEGHNDDLVMTFVLFGWLVRQPMFIELTSSDVRKNLAIQRYQNLMDDLLPEPIIDNGMAPEWDDNDTNWLLR